MKKIYLKPQACIFINQLQTSLAEGTTNRDATGGYNQGNIPGDGNGDDSEDETLVKGRGGYSLW